MNEIKLKINNKEVSGKQGQTILDIARENGIDIPTLCHDDRVEMFGSCGLCVVEAEGTPKLLRACSTFASDGMVIQTETERIRQNRKTALELLLSDHTGDCRPPCALACPAETDCQGYVGLIANGEYEEAYKLIKEKIPLPASVGRVCPHPCEEACRRELVEEPVSIAALKQYIGDLNLANNNKAINNENLPDVNRQSSIGIVGGGPAGLSAAYFLREKGCNVTIYDAMPQMGGMLRYGIPEYRLPKALLQKEIDNIEQMGVEFCNNISIGDKKSTPGFDFIPLEELRKKHNAVIIANGAWLSTDLRCMGETLDGVTGGIGFLLDVAVGNDVQAKGKKIAVVGGGNTAMDACRTALRLGADQVYNIYRRTKNEMPAEEIEIIEAEEEGVVFKNLTNPIEIVGENGKVKELRLQIMELGEPDESGRRRPVPTPGKEEVIEVDTVIIAIGQKINPKGFEAIDKTKYGTIAADEHTFLTNLDGIFAIGDATNNGADIAVTAIGEAKKAVEMVERYLNGEALSFKAPYLVKSEKTKDDLADVEKEPRAKMPYRCANERKKDFQEVNLGLSEEEAKREANRCLECGCNDFFECKLIDYANRYDVRPGKYDGKTHHHTHNDNHPYINRNPDKCILCGLCVRICEEVAGAAALGMIDRGFDTVIKPALDANLEDAGCISCGQCAHVCPTGALTETMMIEKQVPLKETYKETVCSFCSVGCKTKLAVKGNLLTRSIPAGDKEALLCKNGRFGLVELIKKKRLATPLVKKNPTNPKSAAPAWEEYTYNNIADYLKHSFDSLQNQYSRDCIAVSISDRYTNEEAALIKEYANKTLKTDNVFSFNKTDSGIAGVLGRDASTASFDDLESAELIVLVDTGIMKNHGVAGMRIRNAVKKGAKLLLINGRPGEECLLDSAATLKVESNTNTDLSLFHQIKKALQGGKDNMESNENEKEFENPADMIVNANNVIYVFEKNGVSIEAARLIAEIAIAANSRILQLLPGSNSQGLINLGIKTSSELAQSIEKGEIRGLFIFGENPKETDLSKIEFLAVHDFHLTETAELAHAVIPAAHITEKSGSFISADGKIQAFKPVFEKPEGCLSIEELINVL